MQAYQQIDIEISNRDEVIERYIKERDELIAQRAAIAESELAEAVAKVNALGGYATVEPQKKSSVPRAPSTGPKKYRDPATGTEWSGQGNVPKWIMGDDKDHFLNPAWLEAKAAKTTKKAPSSQPADASVVSQEAHQRIDIVGDSATVPLAVSTSESNSVTPVAQLIDMSPALNPVQAGAQLINQIDQANPATTPSVVQIMQAA
jgi:DNA-binding protein H-NS